MSLKLSLRKLPKIILPRRSAALPPPRWEKRAPAAHCSGAVRPASVCDARRDAAADRKKVKNHRWAKLLARTFKVDVGTCPKCGEDMEIMGAVQDPTEVQRYLRHVGKKEHPPPIAAARYVQPQFAFDDCAYEDAPTESI